MKPPGPLSAFASGRRVTGKYAGAISADRYVGVHVGTAHHRRELRCVRRALAGVPPGATVLDMPCGTGRLFAVLADMGFRIAGADVSAPMAEVARRTARGVQPEACERIVVADASCTGFPDAAFDAVLCNRLFHHLSEPGARRVVLAELARVSRGPIAVSFFSSFSYDAWIRRIRGRLLNKPSSRCAIRPGVLLGDFAAVGLTVKAVHWAWRCVSQQAYVVAEAPRAGWA